MFARVTRAQMQIDKIDEAIKIIEESIVPAAKYQKGFRGIYALVDRKTAKGMTISLWDSEEDAIATEESGYYQEQIGKVVHLYTAPSVPEGYEVAVQG